MEVEVGRYVLDVKYIPLGAPNMAFVLVIRDLTWRREQENHQGHGRAHLGVHGEVAPLQGDGHLEVWAGAGAPGGGSRKRPWCSSRWR